MSTLLARASRRYLARRPGQTALTVLGIAVGIAAWVSVETASQGARTAFERSTRDAFGEATHQILPVGRSFDERVYVALRTELGVDRAAPIVAGRLRVTAGGEPAAVDLYGVDPLAEGELRPTAWQDAAAAEGSEIALMTTPNGVGLGAALAGRLGVEAGDPLEPVGLGTAGPVEVTVVVERPPPGTGDETLFADIATAQRMLGLEGRLTRVDLVLPPEEEAAVRGLLPGEATLVSTAARSRSVLGMTRAYETNLTALGLLALLVGLLLVYSAMSHLTVQRARVFRRLAAVGLTARAIRRLVLREAAVLGVAGGVIGAAIGLALGELLVGMMARTVNDLYFELEVTSARPAYGVALWGLAIGVAASLAGAWQPAREAARLSSIARARPTRAARRRSRRYRAAVALAAAAAAAVALIAPGDSLIAAFAGLFLVAFACAVAATLLLEAAARLLAGRANRRLGWRARLALANVRMALPRMAVAIAGLVLAVASVIAVDTMIANFRHSVGVWLYASLPAPFVIGIDEAARARADDEGVESLVAEIEALPGVESVRRLRDVRVRAGPETLRIRAKEWPAAGLGVQLLESGDLDAVRGGEAVLATEGLARSLGLGIGATVAVPFPGGTAALPVGGIIRDYLTDQGMIVMALDRYRALSGDEAVSSLGIELAPAADAGSVRAGLENVIAPYPGLRLGSAAEIRSGTLEIFDRTFAVTRVLKLLAALVAFFAVLGSLLALLLERRPLRQVLHAVGLDGSEQRRVDLYEAGFFGAGAAAAAVPTGLLLTALLIFVINQRSFGWGMSFFPLPGPILQGAALALAAALAAGWLASRLSVARGVPEDGS